MSVIDFMWAYWDWYLLIAVIFAWAGFWHMGDRMPDENMGVKIIGIVFAGLIWPVGLVLKWVFKE